MENIKVSIIMPSLNVKPFIEECIESVLAQTLYDIEVICVDAGSTDGTLEVLRGCEKKDERIKVIVSDKKSYGYQVNIGIDAARGEYIGIVETDDYIKQDMYQDLYSVAKETGVDYVKAGYVGFVHKCGERLYRDDVKGEIDIEYGKVINLSKERATGMKTLNSIWAAIYSREFLLRKNVRVNETPGASYQDTSFSMLVALLADSAVFLDDNYYCYRMDNAGSSVKSDGKINCIIDEYTYLVAELERNSAYTEEVKKLVLTNKLYSYRWNYMRLSDLSAEKFFDSIQDEMNEYEHYPYMLENLSEEECGILKLLTVKELRQNLIDQENHRRDGLVELAQKLADGSDKVIVGAGKYGDRIMFIEDVMGMHVIKTVCDNNSSVQGKKMGNHTVISVEESVAEYPEANYIIAIKNKMTATSIMEQLNLLGIDKGNIYICSELPSVVEIMNMIDIL